MQTDFWTLNALPIVRVVFTAIGMTVAWIAVKRVDRKYGKDGISSDKP